MNISELAQHLDVSVSTVSRVLSGNAAKYRISAGTVERVRAAAEKFNAVPDPLGSSLRSGRLGMIGLLVPDITNPFFSELARAIELRLRDSGMAVLLSDSAEDSTIENHLLTTMLARKLDGLIFAPVGTAGNQVSSAIRDSSMPVVTLDRVIPDLNSPSISLDNWHAGRLAAEHLIAAGHRRIACLRGDNHAFPDRERLRGAREALNAAGCSLDPALFTGDGYSREAGLAGARRLLTLAQPPTAIITLSGQGILGVLQAACEQNLAIPDDLSVVAFDEQPWSAFVNPPLTTVVQPIAEMAGLAVTKLTSLAESSTSDVQVPDNAVLLAHIKARHSVAQRHAAP